MVTVLLIIIYLAFISLGLPDPLLGVSWPLAYQGINAPYEAAGIISITITICTTISALISGWVNRKLGTGKVVLLSGVLTASALLGFAVSHSIYFTILVAIPLGIGAGSVDAAINNYVALHYKAHHMSWLHSFWGVGATLGPIIMGNFMKNNDNWRGGYTAVGLIQFALVAVLLVSLPLWSKVDKLRRNDAVADEIVEDSKPLKAFDILKLRGVKYALLVFVFYCGIEASMGLWGGTFLIKVKGLEPATAAFWVSLYYGGIMVGRMLSGFITMKVSSRGMIRLGQSVSLVGIIVLLLPLPAIGSLVGFLLVGFGLAPIFPSMIHNTPSSFGKMHSQQIIGFQMASAYTGVTCIPPLLGWIATRSTMLLLPIALLLFMVLMLLSSERINRLVKREA